MCLAVVARILGDGTVQEGKVEKAPENMDVFNDRSSSLLILSDGSRK